MVEVYLAKLDNKGNVINEFSIISLNDTDEPFSITTDGVYLYVLTGKIGGGSTVDVYKFDKKGNLILTQPITDGSVGIVFDGEYFVTLGSLVAIIYDSKFNVINNVSIASNYSRCTFDGKNIIAITGDAGSSVIDTLDRRTFEIIKSSSSPVYTSPTIGITFNGEDIIESHSDFDGGTGTTMSFENRNFVQLRQITPSVIGYSTDICFDGEFYWMVEKVTG